MWFRDEKDRLWESVHAAIGTGKVTEDSPLSVIVPDAEDVIELAMQAEEAGVAIQQLETIGDLLRLLKVLRFQRDLKARKRH